MSDETIIVKNQGTIFLAGPPLVKASTGEEVTAEELGGGDMHTRKSGVADYLAENDADALRITREIIRNLSVTYPRNPLFPRESSAAPLYAAEDLLGIIPKDLRVTYDVREVIARL